MAAVTECIIEEHRIYLEKCIEYRIEGERERETLCVESNYSLSSVKYSNVPFVWSLLLCVCTANRDGI